LSQSYNSLSLLWQVISPSSRRPFSDWSPSTVTFPYPDLGRFFYHVPLRPPPVPACSAKLLPTPLFVVGVGFSGLRRSLAWFLFLADPVFRPTRIKVGVF